MAKDDRVCLLTFRVRRLPAPTEALSNGMSVESDGSQSKFQSRASALDWASNGKHFF